MKLPEGFLQECKTNGYTKREIASLRRLIAKQFYVSPSERDPDQYHVPMEMFLPEGSNDN